MSIDSRTSEIKTLDVDRFRRLVRTKLQDEGWSLHHFCTVRCDPPVDPSNFSGFMHDKRSGMTRRTVAAVVAGLNAGEYPAGLRPSELYRDPEAE